METDEPYRITYPILVTLAPKSIFFRGSRVHPALNICNLKRSHRQHGHTDKYSTEKFLMFRHSRFVWLNLLAMLLYALARQSHENESRFHSDYTGLQRRK